ncbi:MAG: hypothetical protein AMXMBFR33_09810 [Candidatus Xenobia bacterium]|jgi:hypothetical protein
MHPVRILTLWCLLFTLAAADSAFGGKLKFDLPNGFRAMTASEIGQKFPTTNPPQVAYANPSMSCTVALTHSASKLEPAKLPEFKSFLESNLRQRPDLEWESSELVSIGGRKWLRFVFVSAAVDQKIRNEMLGTSFEGRALLINLNCTVKDYPSYKARLDKLRESFRI